MANPNLDIRPALKAEDMDITGNLFGLRIRDREDKGHYQEKAIVELYIEDDTNDHFKTCFHVFWLNDLENVVKQAIDQWGTGV
jgi:hypothetical protein